MNDVRNCAYKRVLIHGFFVLSLSAIISTSSGQGVVLNELMASNSKVVFDHDGDYSDWIELYNSSAGTVDLTGYTLTDDPGGSQRWALPAINLEPGGFLLVWASDKDRSFVDGIEATGGGHDVWSDRDGFHFEYQRVQDAFETTVHVRSLSDTNQWAKAGLMVRDALTSDARHAFIRLTPDHGLGWQWRATTGGLTETTGSVALANPSDGWLRLTRSGDRVDVDYGADGTNWTRLGGKTLTGLTSSLYVGVAVCSHDSGELATVVYSDYQTTPSSAVIPGGGGLDLGTGDLGTSRVARVLHTDFKLKRGGETIALYNASGTLLDSLAYPSQTRDASYGRTPDGGAWAFLDHPTPESANSLLGATGHTAQPTFSTASGVYTGPLLVGMTCATPGATIYYSLDGSLPTTLSTPYASVLNLTTVTVVRARAFATGRFPSPVAAASYLVDQPRTLPAISIVTNPDNLWGPTGIYDQSDQHGRAWERPCWIDYITTDGQSAFGEAAGIRIHGGASRGLCPKKSLRLYFRSEYGASKLPYSLFPDSSATQYDKIVLRAGFNDCWAYFQETPDDTQRRDVNYVRDQVTRDLHLEMGYMASHGRFAEVYLNGAYWGLYNPSERVEAKFAGTYTDNNDWDIVKLEGEVADGDDAAWEALRAECATTDFSSDANFQAFAQKFDVAAFTDYVLLNIWMQATDWPAHNGYFATMRNMPVSSWRPFLWDSEVSFGTGIYPGGWRMDQDMVGAAISPSSAIGDFSSSLIVNAAYCRTLIRRLDVLLNSHLGAANVIQHLNARFQEIEPVLGRESARWGRARDGMPQRGYADWLVAAQRSRDFATSRPEYVRQHMKNQFSEITGWTNVTINPPTGGPGAVVVEGLRPTAYPWTGVFFTGLPLTLQAIPAHGYRFIGWSDPALPSSSTVQVTISTGGDHLIASGASWRYNDTGVDLGTSWRAPGYDDSTWSSGPAQLGYGDTPSDEATLIGYGGDPNNKYPCYYFRHTFNVSVPSSYDSVSLELMRDDGAVVYLNGVEILRDNMPTTGTIAYHTYADNGVGGSEESTFYSIEIPVSSLAVGPNVLAVEVHQVAPDSSDVSFDCRLIGQRAGTGYVVNAVFARANLSAGALWQVIE